MLILFIGKSVGVSWFHIFQYSIF